MPEAPKTVGLVVKRHRAEASALAATLAEHLRARAVRVLVEPELTRLPGVEVVDKTTMVRQADLIDTRRLI